MAIRMPFAGRCRAFALLGLTTLALSTTLSAIGAGRPPRETELKVNLVKNPGAESGQGSDNGSVVEIPQWKVVGNFTAVKYGVAGFPPIRESIRIDGGDHFFAGGPEDHQSRAIQKIDVADLAGLIDREKLAVALRAQQAGYRSQPDKGEVLPQFLDERDRIIGRLRLPAVEGTDEVFHEMRGRKFLPEGTRALRVILIATHGQSDYLDAYFDNIDVRVGRRGSKF